MADTLSFAIEDGVAAYLGWMIAWNATLTLLAATREQVAEAQRELCRIAVGRPQAAATGGPQQRAGAADRGCHGTPPGKPRGARGLWWRRGGGAGVVAH